MKNSVIDFETCSDETLSALYNLIVREKQKRDTAKKEKAIDALKKAWADAEKLEVHVTFDREFELCYGNYIDFSDVRFE